MLRIDKDIDFFFFHEGGRIEPDIFTVEDVEFVCVRVLPLRMDLKGMSAVDREGGVDSGACHSCLYMTSILLKPCDLFFVSKIRNDHEDCHETKDKAHDSKDEGEEPEL